VEQVDFLCKPS